MVPTTAQALARVVAHLAARNPDLAGKPGKPGRLDKAQELVAAGAVDWAEERGCHLVGSQSNPLGTYQVNLVARTCTCPDQPRAPRGWCKHLLAVAITGMADIFIARQAFERPSSVEAGQWRQLVDRVRRLAALPVAS